jgi:hypothetical protein
LPDSSRKTVIAATPSPTNSCDSCAHKTHNDDPQLHCYMFEVEPRPCHHHKSVVAATRAATPPGIIHAFAAAVSLLGPRAPAPSPDVCEGCALCERWEDHQQRKAHILDDGYGVLRCVRCKGYHGDAPSKDLAGERRQAIRAAWEVARREDRLTDGKQT